MNKAGDYQKLFNFDVGHYIAVNGTDIKPTNVCERCDVEISRHAKICKKCYQETCRKDDCNPTTARQRKEVRDYRGLHTKCEICHINETEKRLEVHHIDGDPFNNEESNFLVVCPGCHRKEDMKRVHFGNPYSCRYIMYDQIVSIKHVGQENVYDLVMEGPNHNFIANGFVSHNSGPDPLTNLFRFTVKTFKEARGRKLTTLECHDIVCMIGESVVAGGSRRSALISLSDLTDDRMRNAKNGAWWNSSSHRSLANNSAVYNDKTPAVETFMSEWKSLYDSKSGERGIFSRYAAKAVIERLNDFRKTNFAKVEDIRYRETDYDFGTNPCSEIILRDKQFCNLSEVVIRSGDSVEDLKRKVRLATILGTFQSTLTNFKFLERKWKNNTEDERLLGVSLTGIMDNKLTSGKGGNENLKNALTEMRKVAIETNCKFAKKIGIPMATAITAIKPSGTVSQLVDSASGIHTRHSDYYIRTIRVNQKDPIGLMMKDQGFYAEPDLMRPDKDDVFYFPIKSPTNAITRHDLTAIQQLEIWKLYQLYWCEHKPSVTISVKEHEWISVGAWVYENFMWASGFSFLPFTDSSYSQMPFTECDKMVHDKWVEKIPKAVDWSKLSLYENEDNTSGSRELACSGNRDLETGQSTPEGCLI